nr:pyridoxal-dependent decarboxylase [Kibdelosporangium sp. MJ126-NF4]CEL21012.1 Aromatic-L-amino-acid decarboxylase [Kibdelosporangium sp. MJ126-NF4]CTQ95474.1 Aromatic-L-amino-acid decarboxylase (EC 4.1.1.28) [Kibdelosporangium sp. MJ126-NF4]
MSLLALTENERAEAGRELVALLDDYERSIPARPIVPPTDRDALLGLLDDPFAESGVGVTRLFEDIKERVLPNSTTIAHPRFLAYVTGPPNGIAPYVEAIAAAINQNCNFAQLSPAASVIEQSVVRWLAGLFGWGGQSGGIITDGGSMATLNALTTALHAHCPDFRARGLQAQQAPLVLYTSEQAHRSVDKAAAILGLGLGNVRAIPTDSDFRMRADVLRQVVEDDLAAGLRPFCVVATSGTVATGAIDPIDEIADICADHGLWLHIDGAYGGLFVLSERVRAALAACTRADSISVDPHKLLFAPMEAGCLIVRDRRRLADAFSFSSSYLTVADDPLMVDYMDYGPQLSRSFKAFKVWGALRAFGVGAFRGAIDENLDLARYFAERVTASPVMELMAPVTLTAVCLRLTTIDGSAHDTVLRKLNAEGTALLGPIRLNGRDGIRACVTNYRTTKADIDLIVDRLADLARSYG